jgi:hypothetical protein
MREEAIRGAHGVGEAGGGADETADVPRTTKTPPSRDYNNRTTALSRQQQASSPALHSSSSGLLSLTRGRGRGRADEEEQLVEQKLSEKLMDGFLLLEKACPCCATPLVKQEESADLSILLQQHAVSNAETKSYQKSSDASASSRSTQQQLQATVTPIAGIPFCVTCQAHIVTNEVEAVALQERYAGKTVQGKIMVAVSNSPSSLPTTNYSGGWSLRSQASKKSVRSISSIKGNKNNVFTNSSTHCGSTVLTDDMRDEVSTLPSVQSKPRGAQMSPALLTMKDTVEMFRSSDSSSLVCPKQKQSPAAAAAGVPDTLTSPLSCRPSISNITSSPAAHVAAAAAAAAADKRQEKQSAPKRRTATRLARRRQAFAIAHGGTDEIEIICAESTQWFSVVEQDNNDNDDDETDADAEEEEEDVKLRQAEEKEVTACNESKHSEEEMTTMRDDEDDDEEDEEDDSLKVMTSQDGGPFEAEPVNVPAALETKATEDKSIGHRSKQSTTSIHQSKQCNSTISDQSNKQQSRSVQKVNEKEPGREYEEEKSSEKIAELELGRKEVVVSEKGGSIVHQASANTVSSESRQQAPEIAVFNESATGKDLQESDRQMNDVAAKDEVTAETAIEAKDDVLVNVVDDHDDIHEISVDHEDLMVGSCEDLTTEGSHLADQEHDDESWPSYEER